MNDEHGLFQTLKTVRRTTNALLIATLIAGLVDVAIWCVVAWQTSHTQIIP